MTVAFNSFAQSTQKALTQQAYCKPGIAAGTPILTQTGLRPVESLHVGDKIVTRDRGLQPLRWIDASTLQPGTDTAPVHFQAGALGDHGAVTLAANTRVLIRDKRAKALFGESEVFAFAADLINDTTISAVTADQPLHLLHLLFDQHEILRAAELEVESLHPDRALMRQLDEATQNSLLKLLPNTDALMGYGYGPTARSCLRRSEARTLCSEN